MLRAAHTGKKVRSLKSCVGWCRAESTPRSSWFGQESFIPKPWDTLGWLYLKSLFIGITGEGAPQKCQGCAWSIAREPFGLGLNCPA